MTPSDLIKRKWKPHQLIVGMYSRDGGPYVSEQEAIATEFAEALSRARLRARGAENPYAGEIARNADKRAREESDFYANETEKRREYYERHYVVPTVDVDAERMASRKKRQAIEEWKGKHGKL